MQGIGKHNARLAALLTLGKLIDAFEMMFSLP